MYNATKHRTAAYLPRTYILFQKVWCQTCAVNSSAIDRFSKFFHCWKQKELSGRAAGEGYKLSSACITEN